MPAESPLALPTTEVEELIRALVKALRAFQMYLPNNPMYHRAAQQLRDAFPPVWGLTEDLILTVAETDLVWEEQLVYHQANKTESFAWMLYKDGMRVLTLKRGVEQEEIVRLLQTVTRARLLAADAGDDLLTLLWEQDFHFIEHRFAEVIVEGIAVLDPQAVDMAYGAEDAPTTEERAEQVREEAQTARPKGVIDPDDFDSTLYFLDEEEIRALQTQVQDEYIRDVRSPAMAAALDVFELEPTATVRAEVMSVLEQLFPNLLHAGEFRTVALILREIRLVVGRVRGLTTDIKARIQGFETRLSEPAIVAQLVQALDGVVSLPPDEDIGEVLRELRAPALETLLTYLPRLSNPQLQALLEAAADRIAANNTAEVLRLLRQPKSGALPALVRVCGRLSIQPAVPGLTEVLEHEDSGLRLSAVESLAAIASPGALTALERSLDDPDRAVRVAAVTAVMARGFKGAQKRLELAVQGKGPVELERAEKRQFFEAYAIVAGAPALPVFAEILEPRGLFRKKGNPETRTCAAYAVGRIRTDEARAILQRVSNDKELSVRNAAARALREWGG